MCPIFVIKFSGVSDLQGVKVPVFPLTLLVIVTTVLRYRAACSAACDVPVPCKRVIFTNEGAAQHQYR